MRKLGKIPEDVIVKLPKHCVFLLLFPRTILFMVISKAANWLKFLDTGMMNTINSEKFCLYEVISMKINILIPK